ncbi:MAG: metallophosphatase family protein [Clostridiaceae bacterium]|nr:metallophosphatase family protein [Clostridiaceae bacterium]
MKIAVISDIHGNMQALEAVLADIKNQGCQKILCLGDLALAGPEPDRVIDFIKSQEDWIIIQGNTDKMIADFNEEILKIVKEAFPAMGNSLENDVQIISTDNKQFLKNLPENKKYNLNGVKILMVHGSPRRNNEDIMPDMPISKIEEITQGVDSDVVFCGHTHIPCGYQTGSKLTVVNVGSVGRPMTPDAKPCYVIANVENGGFSIEHRFVDYDREKAAKLMSERDFDGAGAIAGLLIKPSSRHGND